jgi:hypothetical protein
MKKHSKSITGNNVILKDWLLCHQGNAMTALIRLPTDKMCRLLEKNINNLAHNGTPQSIFWMRCGTLPEDDIHLYSRSSQPSLLNSLWTSSALSSVKEGFRSCVYRMLKFHLSLPLTSPTLSHLKGSVRRPLQQWMYNQYMVISFPGPQDL